ncbi:hypothetical protein TA3x_004195 [Tundrisphaera sp. TA3]|uniref:hypothetical protein n=1 Tax=Tundrisphaera sp. TA3 TaxID=3435775 RepID=UPI003EC0CC8D
MPGHDQTDDRRLRRAIAWLLPIALVLASATARGEDEFAPAAPPSSWKGSIGDPVRLTADRVQCWDGDEGDRWALLEDQAEVAQGASSLRADRIVVRIGNGDDPGSIRRVSYYAEGSVRTPEVRGSTRPDDQATLATSAEVHIDARVPDGLHKLAVPPRGLPLLARAFPKQEAAPAIDPTGAAPPAPEPAVDVAGMEPATPGTPAALPVAEPAEAAPAPADASILATQFSQDRGFADEKGFADDLGSPPQVELPAEGEPLPGPALVPEGEPFGPSSEPPTIEPFAPGTTLEPLPDGTPAPRPAPEAAPDTPVPIQPGSQRVTTVRPLGTGQIEIETLPVQADGSQIVIIRGGVNLQTRSPERGINDLEADNVVIYRHPKPDRPAQRLDLNNQFIDNDADPMEVYLEGHVIVRQDALRLQGKSDQKTFEGERAYYDFGRDRLLAVNAQVEVFAPGFVAPIKFKSPRVLQYHPLVAAANGQMIESALPEINTEQSVTTGSRFAKPGYRFTSRSLDLRQVVNAQAIPDEENPDKPFGKEDLTWLIDARQNFFFFGPVPVFYFPRFYAEADDLDPPLQGLSFATNNFFGQQVRTDWNVFKLLNMRRPPQFDNWNLDVDYLSARAKKTGYGIALGSELGWYGGDLINDIKDPFNQRKNKTPSRLTNYAGYFDLYGLFDGARDVLGGGPAIITNGPNDNAAGKAGFSRISNPTYQDFRGRVTLRHMQSFLSKDAPLDEDFRLNAEIGFTSDRNFLEQYFKRLFDTGLDQENLLYLIKQKENTAITAQAEVNLQKFQTETQWLPKLDYYRLGDSLFGDRLNYFQHTGVDYANVHTAAEVNNPTLFAFLPIDPVTNTSGRFESGRIFTAHELDAPLKFNFLRVTPYLQGQLVGWNNQISGNAVGRYWGAGGARADIMVWKAFPTVESELFNLHGLNHKIDFVANYRTSYSNVGLNSIGVQDDLDDNTYEYTRRYFALTNYVGGLLPAQYDPRNLILRRGLSPITGTTDVQASIQTLNLGIHQRLQTRRGQEGKRHITDYMVFDLDTTYFPNAARDNFNKPFGQNFYNYEWYIGDRTSFVSYGWFEFFKIAGTPYVNNPTEGKNDPFGLRIITSGVSITRIPKGNIFVGYSIVNTGPIATSALNASYTYWLSPKWYGTAATTYDFGNKLLLGASGSLTRIGADYLTSVGLAVSPLQNMYQFVFEISPRLSPNMRVGSASGLSRVDTRFAPVE